MTTAPVLYVDSADLALVGELLRDGLVTGVTTNPTILERGGHALDALPDLYQRWVDEGASQVFFQTWGATTEEMLTNAAWIKGFGDRVAVKVPATRAGFAAVTSLVQEDTTVLITAVYSVAQALAGAAYGARDLAPYLGRLRDAGLDGDALIGDMQAACAGADTDVLAASLRSPDDIVGLRRAGVSHFTAAPQVILDLLTDDISDRSAEEFEGAIGRIRG